MNKHVRRLLAFTAAFVVCTVAGTLSHEFGHIAMAKLQGFTSFLHYDHINYRNSSCEDLHSIRKSDLSPFEKEKAFREYGQKMRLQSLLITMGGPLQTILTGTIGLIILLYRRKYIAIRGMKIFDWIAVFLSLFWLREVSYFIFQLYMYVWKGRAFIKGRGDENKINGYFDLPPATIPIICFLIGSCIVLYVIFRIIPKEYRFVFICSGLIGGILGSYIWFTLIGPVILP